MEAETILKNAANPKSQRLGLNFNKFLMAAMLMCFFSFTNKAVGQFAGGSGTETDPYLISTPEQLAELKYHTGNANVHFMLLNNIDLTSYLASGGAGHNGGYAANKINGNGSVGGLVGSSIFCIITDCYATGDVSGNGEQIGGLVGHGDGNNTNGRAINCYATGNVSGYRYVGGLFGGRISGAYGLGMRNCYATGSVSGYYDVGGLAGNATGIYNCYASGNIIGYNNNTGGLVGAGSNINTSYAIGNVNGNSNVGGLVGSGFDIGNCYATVGTVSGNSSVGGVVGNLEWYGGIGNCYATGNVSGYTNIGGLIGYRASGGNVDNCFFDYQTTGQTYGIGGGSGGNVVGKPTTEMKKKSTFTSAEWNFITLWNINEGITYPFFNNEPILIVSPTSHNFDKNSGSIKIEVSSNVEWAVTKEADWLTIYTTSGSNYGSFYIYVSQNTDTQRSTIVTVSGGGKTATISITQAGTVGIEEVESDKLQIFPNPVNDEIFIKSELQIERVEIYSLTGSLLKFENNFKGKVSVATLAQGIYLLKVHTDKGLLFSKFVKE